MRILILDSSHIITNLIVIFVVLLLATLFVASEFALVKIRISALEDAQNQLPKPSKKIARAIHMVNNLNEYLSTTQVGITLAGLILGWLGESTISELLLNLGFVAHLSDGPTTKIIASVVALVLLTYIEVVFTELVPKNVAIDMPMKVLMFVTGPLHFFHVVFYPFVWFLNTSANHTVKLFGLKPADENDETFSEAEILSLSRNAVHGGQLSQEDFVFMQRAFQMNDKVAVDIMIDRTQLEVLDITTTVKEALAFYLQEQFSRFPVVANNDKDKVLGYVYAFDLVRQSQVDGSILISKLIRNIEAVPENMPLHAILKKMIEKRTPIVVVADEYGGTSGIITDKDIYEELFGTVRDEIDDVAEDLVQKTGENTYIVPGKMTMYDFERFFQVNVPQFQDSEMVTLSGFMIDENKSLKVNQVIKIDNFDFKVLDYTDAFINNFEVTVNPIVDEDNDDSIF